MCAGLLALFCAHAVAAQNSAPAAPTGDLGGDIDIFTRQVVEADRSFSPTARAAARVRVKALGARLDHLDAVTWEVELCRIAALADNAHTGCWRRPIAAPVVGPGFFALQGEIYVVQADAPDADLVGGRLLAIDDQPVTAVRRQVRTLAGGRPGWRDAVTAYAYSRPAVLHALGAARSQAAAVYRIHTVDGRVVERRLTAGPPARPASFLVPPERAPWIMRDVADAFRWRDAPEHGAIVIQLRTNLDQPGRPLTAFLEEVERQRAALGRKTVVIDLRGGDGGDMTLSREFFAALPSRVGAGGRFLVLLGPRSISAGLANVAYLKQAGGPQVTILGESPGDGPTFFSEGGDIRLPGTGLLMQNALERDDLKDGCRPYADCFAGLAQPGGPTGTPADRASYFKRMPVSVASLEPDVSAPVRITDYLAGRDTGLAKALELARPCARAAHPAACEAETRELAGPIGTSPANP